MSELQPLTNEPEEGAPSGLAPANTPSDSSGHVPRIAVLVCAYHVAIFAISLGLTTFVIGPEKLVSCSDSATTMQTATVSSICRFEHRSLLVFVFLFGALGSTLAASRIVVLALRYKNYQSEKVAWQLLTPLHGGVLAVVGLYVVLGGLLAMVRSPAVGPEFGFFVGGFAFIVGFSSELFVKRLIRATEALFGEQEDRSVDAVSHDPHD